jgi:hypothetical protein
MAQMRRCADPNRHRITLHDVGSVFAINRSLLPLDLASDNCARFRLATCLRNALGHRLGGIGSQALSARD